MNNKVELVGYYGSDLEVCTAAWTSTSRELTEEKKQPERQLKLLKMLASENHHTPFERPYLHFLITADTASHIHILKHRIGFCLDGDSEIWLESVTERSGRTIRKRKIRDLYNRWYSGVVDKPHRRIGRHGGLTEEISSRVRLLPQCRGYQLRMLNEDSNIFEIGKAGDIISAGKKEVLELVTEKYTLRCTPEHQILTDKGWAKAGDLQRLDCVMVAGKIVKNAGPKVPKYLRTGIGIWTQKMRTTLIRPIDYCHGCNGEFPFDELELDHIIPVYKDLEKALSISNLRPLCCKCHSDKTATEQVQGNEQSAGARRYPLLKTPEIVAETDTYDLSVEGKFHNFVANGFVVHNSTNGESARYRELKEDKALVPQDWPIGMREMLEEHNKESFDRYHEALAKLVSSGMNRKRAKESARFFLPYSNQLVLDCSMNLRAFFHFQGLRNSEHAQLEIREIAQNMLRLVKETGAFPLSLEAFGY